MRVEGNIIRVAETRDDPLGDSRVWIFRGEVLPESAAELKKGPARPAPARVTTGGATPTPVQ